MKIESRGYEWMMVLFFAAWLIPVGSAWAGQLEGDDPITALPDAPGAIEADPTASGTNIDQWVRFAEKFRDSCTPEGLAKRITKSEQDIEQTNANQEILEAERKGKLAPQEEQLKALTTLKDDKRVPDVCKAYCAETTREDLLDLKLDVCAFSDPMLVAVGLEVAPNDMQALKEKIIKEMGEEPAAGGGFGVLFNDAIQAATDVGDSGAISGAAVARGSVTALLQRGLGALARVIADRAKREAIGWLLDDVASELCGDDLKDTKRETAEKEAEIDKLGTGNPAKKAYLNKQLAKLETESPDHIARYELRNHWMSNLCSLAREDRLDHYGAGAALLEALQGALENDVRGWPGVVAGIGLGEFHWKAVHQPAETQTFALAECFEIWTEGRTCQEQCDEKTKKTRETTKTEKTKTKQTPEDCLNECSWCTEVGELRTEGERFVARLMEGRDPVLATRDLGTAVSSIIVPKTGEVTDAPLELLACGVSLPAEIALLEGKFAHVGVNRPLTAAILAGLIRAPACWELTGKGYDSSFEGSRVLARKNYGKPRERISTILELAKQVQALERVQVEFVVLRQAVDNLEVARNRKTKDDARAREIFLATLGVVDASLASADALLAAVARFSDVNATFPAIETFYECDTKATNRRDVKDDIENIHAELAELRDLLTTLQGFGMGEYAKAITASSKLMLERLEQVCESDETSREKCRERVDAVGRHIGTVTAILTAENVDDMAAALDAAANPPGGWRSKAMPGNLTVSLTAYPGFLAGGEVRWGQYGALREQGGVYGQAPTLAMPFGLDVAWGCETRGRDWTGGLFFPLIDPAAFLLYDVDQGGKLPGPRPVTALSPGVAVRLGIPQTPLAILLSATYRPQLRTWQATVSGPGADVIQFGLSVAVDVTLWKIFARGK